MTSSGRWSAVRIGLWPRIVDCIIALGLVAAFVAMGLFFCGVWGPGR